MSISLLVNQIISCSQSLFYNQVIKKQMRESLCVALVFLPKGLYDAEWKTNEESFEELPVFYDEFYKAGLADGMLTREDVTQFTNVRYEKAFFV